ncbi:bacterial bifunctional deaminase-reductase [Setomelanomma holmii]|uniref:2,5-diamino-6-ribosylamino-4(3H)-pyrimidinone 5'-phosphate reductase n=1 Tax=Setomelanomma holmii TaxID=210430 RepID=A0A9P4LQR3_9PLEO|nr:bacterial bifunctional deaminase-reductase [Setomelanomma holmii]
MEAPTRDSLRFPASQAQHIDPYIPSPSTPPPSNPISKPHVTLTFATSLDSQLSLAPGVQTALSGPESKAMTHYLRSWHDAILIGAGTAIADNPSLNCRIGGVGGYGGEGLERQPRPVIIDPKGRWNVTAESKCVQLAASGRGKGPWIVTFRGAFGREDKRRKLLESVGGAVLEITIVLATTNSPMPWSMILSVLAGNGIKSVMIEGGGTVINGLISPANIREVDSVIITIAPVWLGKGGVQVCPDEREQEGNKIPIGRLKDVKWLPLGDDVVLCGRPNGS